MQENESEEKVGSPSHALEPAFRVYFPKAAFAAVVTFVAIQFVDRSGVWLFSLLCLLLAIPIFSQSAYFRAVRQMHWLLVFREGGRVRRYFSGRVLRLVVSIPTGLFLAFVMVFRLRALGWQEWLTCAAALPGFWIAVCLLQRLVEEANRPFSVFVRVKSACWVMALVLLVVYGAILLAFPDPSASQFAPWIRHGEEGLIVSAAVQELDALHDGWRALEAFVLGHVSHFGTWGYLAAFVTFVAGNATFFYACASLLAYCSIPHAELSRGFCRPATNAESPTTLAGIVLTSAFVTIIACFLYVQGFAKLEAVLLQLPPEQRPMYQVRQWATAVNANPQSLPEQLQGPYPRSPGPTKESGVAVQTIPAPIPRQAKVLVEKIGDQFYRPGTVQKINEARLDFLSSQLKELGPLAREIDLAFDRMEESIDAFLDWYYSLPGEYTRLVKLLSGSFEGYLAARFSAYLGQGAPFEQFEGTFSALMESESDLKARYKQTIKLILAENSVSLDDRNVAVLAEEIRDAESLFSYEGLVASIEARLATSGILGGVGVAGGAAAGVKVTGIASKKISAVVGKKIAAAVAKSVTKNLVAKGAFNAAAKAAAKVMAKVAASRAASGVGAVVGGAVGSIVPIAGTAAGAIAGGAIVGLAFGVGVDALLLQLDEAMNRSEFRAELVGALNQERQRMLGAIDPGHGQK